MSEDATPVPSQREILQSLQNVVDENLSLLLPIEKAWQPTDYLPDMTASNWHEQLMEFRAPAEQLSDPVLIVLVGDMVTEEALPSYSMSLNMVVQDQTGTSPEPWARWLRGWTAEENRHGDLLNAFLRYTGRVDMRAVEVTINHLLANGFDPKAFPDLYAGLIYTSFQERATKISHNNVAKLAEAEGNIALGGICRRIAGDEARHEAFYTRMMEAVFDLDPQGAMITCGNMLRRIITMPGRLMYDGKDPDLFDHFAIVAQRLGVYTVFDYASIVRHLNETWKIAQRSVSGKAARMQEFLGKHAERLESMAETVADNIKKQPLVQFSWVQNRPA